MNSSILNHKIGIDGGTGYAKICLFCSSKEDIPEGIEQDAEGICHVQIIPATHNEQKGTLVCGSFKVQDIEKFAKTSFAKLMTSAMNKENSRVVRSTGHGSELYDKMFQRHLNIHLDNQRESGCLVRAIEFLAKEHLPKAFFTYKQENLLNFHENRHIEGTREYHEMSSDLYPYLAVNLRSGMSILKVESPTKYTRLTGSHIGGLSLIVS